MSSSDTDSIPNPDENDTIFSNETRRSVAAACRRKRSVSQIASVLRREEGSVEGVVKRMAEENILIKGPPTDPRFKASYHLAPQFVPQLRAAEKLARRSGGRGSELAPAVSEGQRLLVVGGAGLASLVRALRETPLEQEAQWIARVDGSGQRLLVALPDDGLVADEIEAAVEGVTGTVQPIRIDQFLEFEELERWLRDQA